MLSNQTVTNREKERDRICNCHKNLGWEAQKFTQRLSLCVLYISHALKSFERLLVCVVYIFSSGIRFIESFFYEKSVCLLLACVSFLTCDWKCDEYVTSVWLWFLFSSDVQWVDDSRIPLLCIKLLNGK